MNKGSLLHILAESYNGNDPIGAIQKLLGPPYNIPIDSDINGTPLMVAGLNRNIKMIRSLIECGAAPNVICTRLNSCWTALDYAIYNKVERIVYILLDLGACLHVHYQSLPSYAISFLSNRKQLREVCMTLLACRFRPTCPFDRNVLNIIARMIWDFRFNSS